MFDAGDPVDRDPAIEAGDDYTAREIGEQRGLKDRIVEVVLVGQDDDGKPVYVFTALQSGFRCRITAISGSFPVWTYTVETVVKCDPSQTGPGRWVTDGKPITGVRNRFEWVPTSYPYTHGVGVQIADNTGAVAESFTGSNAGECKIRSIGIGAVVDVSVDYDDQGKAYYSFAAANSAQAD